MSKTYKLEDVSLLKEATVLPDANVLIYKFWPELTEKDKTVKRYQRAFDQLTSQGTRLVVTMNIISEVTNRAFNRRWGEWNAERRRLGRRPITNYKRFRNSAAGLAIMDEIDNRVKDVVMEHVHVVGEKQFDDADAIVLLVASKIDLSDKIIAFTAIARNYIIFTHDGDFLYSSADLLTANGKIFSQPR